MTERKGHWWTVPLYCASASALAYFAELIFLGEAIELFAHDSASFDGSGHLLFYGATFFLILFGGGFLFRAVPRRELAKSCAVLSAINLLGGILALFEQGILLLLMIMGTSWTRFPEQLLLGFGWADWQLIALVWLAAPFLFLLFPKKSPR